MNENDRFTNHALRSRNLVEGTLLEEIPHMEIIELDQIIRSVPKRYKQATPTEQAGLRLGLSSALECAHAQLTAYTQQGQTLQRPIAGSLVTMANRWEAAKNDLKPLLSSRDKKTFKECLAMIATLHKNTAADTDPGHTTAGERARILSDIVSRSNDKEYLLKLLEQLIDSNFRATFTSGIPDATEKKQFIIDVSSTINGLLKNEKQAEEMFSKIAAVLNSRPPKK